MEVSEVPTGCSLRPWGELKERQRAPGRPGLVSFDSGALPVPLSALAHHGRGGLGFLRG